VVSVNTAAGTSFPTARPSAAATAASPSTGQPPPRRRSSRTAYAADHTVVTVTAAATAPTVAGGARPANPAMPAATALPIRSPTAQRTISRAKAVRATRLPVAGMTGDYSWGVKAAGTKLLPPATGMARDGQTGWHDDQSAIMTASRLPPTVQGGGPHRRPRPRGDAPGYGEPGG